MGVLPSCWFMHQMHLVPMEAREGIGTPGAEVTACCEPLYEGWKLTPGPLQEQ